MKKHLDLNHTGCGRNDIVSNDGEYEISAGFCADGTPGIDVTVRRNGVNQEGGVFPDVNEAEGFIRSLIDFDEAEMTCVYSD